jgi:hypothetical protein
MKSRKTMNDPSSPQLPEKVCHVKREGSPRWRQNSPIQKPEFSYPEKEIAKDTKRVSKT